uniref:Uncharacterized protein n=1 Tax=Romanomermis culicivorax TaxID=13658 RepID=A0A915I0F7_ROMCU
QKTSSTVDTISTSSQGTKENTTPSNFLNPNNYDVESKNDESLQSKIKNEVVKSDQIESYQESCRLSASDMQGHRRNISDPSTAAIETERYSAFRPYHSQHQVSVPSVHPCLRPGGAKTPPHTLEAQSAGAGPQHPLTLSPSWNPFDLDDQSFGVHFDELPRRRRGSASSIANVKSRESLVMEDYDPFGAAPFPAADNGRKFYSVGSQKTLLNTLNSTLNPEKFASPSRKVSKYEKLINYLDDIGHHHHIPYSKQYKHHDQQKVALEDHNTNLTVPPLKQKCRIDDASSSGVKYRAMGNRRAVRGSAKDSEADSVGSASDLQARMQVSSTTDEDASDGGDARRSRRRRCEKRRTAESTAVISGDGYDEDQGSENAASSPTDDEDAAAPDEREKDDGRDDVCNANDNSSYDLDLNLEYSPGSKDLDDGETQADVSAAGRRPLLQVGGDDFDDENDYSPGASFSNAPPQFLQDNFRHKHRRLSTAAAATSNNEENLEMNVFSPTSIDTIVTMRRNLDAMKIDSDNAATATGSNNRRTAPSPIFPIYREELNSSQTPSNLVSKKIVGNLNVVSAADVFADAPFQFSTTMVGDFVDDKSSDDEAALVTVSPKKQATVGGAGGGVKSSTHAKNLQSKIEDLKLNPNQYQKFISTTSSSGAGSNLLAKTMIIDQNQTMNKKSAFVNTSFQGDDNYPNK